MPFMRVINFEKCWVQCYTTTETFADDTIILAVNEDPTTASEKLQNHLSCIENWLKKWKTTIYETKSQYVIFILRKRVLQCLLII